MDPCSALLTENSMALLWDWYRNKINQRKITLGRYRTVFLRKDT